MTVLTNTDERTAVAPRWVHLAWIVVLVLALPVAFLLGESRARTQDTGTLRGNAYVGADQAAARVDGWSYGFTPSATEWFDADGNATDGSAAPCLTHVGRTVPIEFGWSTARTPDGGSYRAVTWVRCR